MFIWVAQYPRARNTAVTVTDATNYSRLLSNTGQDYFHEYSMGMADKVKRFVGRLWKKV